MEAVSPQGACSWGNTCTLNAPMQGLPTTVGTCMPSGGQSPLAHYEPNVMYNCYAGHGGKELGYVGVTSSPVACAEVCDQDHVCEGFVYMYSQSKCWIRGEINLGLCEVGEWGQESSTFSTFTKKLTCMQEGQVCGGPGLPESACCDGMQCQRHFLGTSNLQCVRIPQVTTAAPAVPAALDAYEAHPLYNCYAGHGGVEIGSVAEMQSLETCATICDQDGACNGFVFMHSQGKCWKRAAINLAECEVGVPGQESGEFITFTKKEDQQCVQAGHICGCTGCLTQTCCGNHQCLEVSGQGGRLFCVNLPR